MEHQSFEVYFSQSILSSHWELSISLPSAKGDFQTVRLIAKEICAIFRGEVLEQNGLQYSDFVEWRKQLNQLEGSETGRRSWDWFNLPLFHEREQGNLTPTRSEIASASQIRHAEHVIDGQLDSQLGSAVTKIRITHETLFFGIWSFLVSQVYGVGEVGLLANGRTYKELNSVIGPLSKYIPVRSCNAKSIEFREWLQTCELELNRSKNLQHFFDMDRVLDGTGSRYLPYVFEYHDCREDADFVLNLCGIIDKFDLRLTVLHFESSFRLEVTGANDLASQNDLDRLLVQFEQALSHSINFADSNRSQFEVFAGVEACSIRHGLATKEETKLLHELFEGAADKFGNEIAIIQGDRQITFEELEAFANSIARELIDDGLQTEECVGVSLSNPATAIAMMLGVMKAGGAYMPIDDSLPTERIARSLAAANCRRIGQPTSSTIPSVLKISKTHVFQWTHSEPRLDRPNQLISPNHLAYVLLTSGSSGTPKPVMISHGAVANYLRWFQNECQGTSGHGSILVGSLGFDLTVTSLFVPLITGEPVTIPTRIDSIECIAETLGNRNFRFIKMTPSHLCALLSLTPAKTLACNTNHFVLGGEPLHWHHVRDLVQLNKQLKIVNEYGPTEATVGCSSQSIQGTSEGRIPIGDAIANTSIYILDSMGYPVPPGVLGELYVGGLCVARGYLADPARTAESFLPDPFRGEAGVRMYRTGDLVQRSPSGEIEYCGRADNQVKVRGYRIELEEIDSALRQMPPFVDAVNVAVNDAAGITRIEAFLVPKNQDTEFQITQEEVVRFLSERLPHYMIPTNFRVIARVPLTKSGKSDRNQLAEMCAPSKGGAEPVSELEEELIEIWKEVLDTSLVFADSDFFAIGGDSIRALQVVSRSARQGIQFSLAQLMQFPVLNELAAQATIDSTAQQAVGPGELVPHLRLGEFEDVYPLTSMQEGMLYHRELDRSDPIYHDVVSYHLQAPIDVESMELEVIKLFERHEVLRSSFDMSSDPPTQRIHKSIDCPFEVFDLRDESSDRQQQVVLEALDRERERGFNINVPPLARIIVHICDSSRFHLTFSFHHAILDGWSDATLITELAESYLSGMRGEQLHTHKCTSHRFADFVKEEMVARKRQDSEEFWRQKISDAPFARLPRSRWRMGHALVAEGQHHTVEVDIPRLISEKLESLSEQIKTPMKSTLLALHFKALSVLSGMNRVSSCVTGSGRWTIPGGDAVAGLFLNSVPISLDLSNCSWADLAKRAFDGEQEALSHSLFPIADIKKMFPDSPLSDVIFYFTHYHVYQRLDRFPELEVLSNETKETTSFKLVVSFRKDIDEHRIRLLLTYDRSKIADSEINALAETYRSIVEAAANDPIGPHRSIGPAECGLLPKVHDDSNSGSGHEFQPIHERFRCLALQHPDNIAVVSETEHEVTYSEIERQACQFARQLTLAKIGPEGRVGLCLQPTKDAIVAILAIWKVGAAYVPINPDESPARKSFILDDAGCQHVVVDDTSASAFESNLEIELIYAGDFDRFDSARPASGFKPTIHPHSLAYIIYTSGTSGRPKGSLTTHQNLSSLVLSALEQFDVGTDDRWTLCHSLSFDFSVWEIWGALISGARLLVTSRWKARSPDLLAKSISDQQITVLNLTPSAFESLVSHLHAEGSEAITSLRYTILGGETLKVHSLAKWFKLARPNRARVINMYGITETTVHVTFHETDESDSFRQWGTRIGCPIKGLCCYVLSDEGMELPVGAVGELYVSGLGVSLGYLGRPDLTASAFVPDPFCNEPGGRLYKTGDLASRLSDGSLLYHGRSDLQIKVNGYRIEPQEVERAIEQIPNVLASVVRTAQVNAEDSTLVAFYETKDQAPIPGKYLREELAASLPPYMIPSAFSHLPAIPRTSGGKPNRNSLAQFSAHLQNEDLGTNEKLSATEEIVAGIWQDVLSVSNLTAQSRFFEIGGHSILAARAIARIRRALKVDVPLRMLFENQSVREFAGKIDHLKDSNSVEFDSLPLITPDVERQFDPFPLTDIQQAYWVGREKGMLLGNLPAHAYLEFQSTDLKTIRLQSAVNSLIEQHGMLRAIILPNGSQKILAEVPKYEIRVTDCSSLSENEAQKFLESTRQEIGQQSFDTAQWPLFEVRITRLSDRICHIHLSIDLLIVDADSLAILGRDLEAFYLDETRKPRRPSVSFRDYVLAERALRQTPFFQSSRDYWLKKLPNLPSAPKLPLAGDLENLSSTAFQRRNHTLDHDLWIALKKRAALSGLTPSGFLLSVYAMVLSRWSESQSFTINVTTYNCLPLHSELENLVGDFTCLTLVAISNQEQSFRSEAQSIQQSFLDDLDHNLFNGVEVMRARAAMLGKYEPIPFVFTSTLPLHSREQYPDRSPIGNLIHGITQSPQTLLDHQVSEDDRGLGIRWDHLVEAFPAGMIDKMFEEYIRSLKRLAEDESAWDLTAAELIPGFALQANQCDDAATGRLEEPIVDWARRTPDATAVIAQDRSLTYGELLAFADSIAQSVTSTHTTNSKLVGVLCKPGWKQVVAIIGILRAGFAYLPIDSTQPKERIKKILQIGEVDTLVTMSEPDDLHWMPADVRLVQIQDKPASKANFVAKTSDFDVAYVMFTSGSTGTPKGVMMDHRAALNTVNTIVKQFGISSNDRVLALSSASFDLSVFDIFGILGAGGTLVYPNADRRKDPAHWRDLINQLGVTVWNTVPAMMEMLLECDDEFALDSSLRLVFLSGDWIPLSLPDRIKCHNASARVISLGGATEAGIWSIFFEIGDIDSKWVSIPYGTSLEGQVVEVLDEDLKPCPPWVSGMIYISGASLSSGYWNDPVATERSFITSSDHQRTIYRTGDLGRYHADGTIEIIGREDDQVKIGGHRIELGEIELALQRIPGVTSAIARVVERNSRKSIVGYITASTLADKPIDGLSISDRPPISLHADTGSHRQDNRICRRSHRTFDSSPLTLKQVCSLLEPLACNKQDGHWKYRYASASGLYAVSIFIHLNGQQSDTLTDGVYLYDPKQHQLCWRSSGSSISSSIHWPENRPAFDSAAMTIYFVADMNRLRAKYRDAARDFALLEAGLMTQLVDLAAEKSGLGTCQVASVDFEVIRSDFRLNDGEAFLHSVFSGMPNSHATKPTTSVVTKSELFNDVSEEVSRYLRETLPDYMRPACVLQMSSFPVTANGKIDRSTLPIPSDFDDRFYSTLDTTDSNTDFQRADFHHQMISDIVNKHLGTSSLDWTRNFFEAGADSLTLVRIHREIRHAMGIDFSVAEMFSNPSIRQLAKRLSELGLSDLGSSEEERSQHRVGRRAQYRKQRALENNKRKS
ncbi:non-ribosomal peptide synthetase [Blastopirellula retiformator]|nr:non-ribosomal peptide synthetase [Blastopirellula retiformator]